MVWGKGFPIPFPMLFRARGQNRLQKRKIPIIAKFFLLPLALYLFVVPTAFGAVLASQPELDARKTYGNTTLTDINRSGTLIPNLLTPPKSLLLTMSATSTTGSFSFFFKECTVVQTNMSGIDGCITKFSFSTTSVTFGLTYTFSSTTPFFIPTINKFYYLVLQRRISPDNDLDIWGTYSTTSYPTFCSDSLLNLTNCAGFTPYFILSSDVSFEIFDTTQISNRGINANCSITDISGCIINALSWAFVPSQEVLTTFSQLTLASTTPFNYLYELQDYFVTLKNGVGTSTVLELPFMNGTLKFFDSQNISTVVGTDFATFFTYVKTLLSYFIWFSLIFIMWREAFRII